MSEGQEKLQGKPLKYEAIKAAIRSAIDSGELPPGSRLPPERRLAERFDCNYHTVRHALKELKELGLIVRQVGSGTFVAELPAAAEPVPDIQAQSRLGIIFQPALADDYAWKILEHLNNLAGKLNVRIEMRMVNALDAEALRAVAVLQNQECSAIILPWFGNQPHSVLQYFVRHSPLPVVLPDLVPGLEINCMQSPDLFGEGDYAMIEAQCRYMVGVGCRHLALFGPDRTNTTPFQRRLMGYSQFVNSREMEANICLVDDSAASVDRVVERCRRLIPGLGIIAYDDQLAVRLITSLHKLGFKIPDEVAIIGSNDAAACVTANPPLTSVQAPYAFAAEHLIRHALAMADGGSAQTRCHAPINIISRESCGEKHLDPAELARIVASVSHPST